MPRPRSLAALVVLTLLATACGVDRATGPYTDPLLVAAVGSDPSPLSASPTSPSAISLTWQDNSPNEDGFEVHRSTNGASGVFTRVAAVPAKSTAYSDIGLQQLTEYCYKVRAYRTNGGKAAYSNFSNVACATTFGTPPAPATVTVSPRENATVLVSWSSSATANGYRVYRAADPAGSWELLSYTNPASPVTDYGRAAEQQVCYRIAAYNQWGDGMSAARCTTPPASPTTLSATVPAGGGIDLQWTGASAFEDGYEVQRAGADYQFASLATTGANVMSYHDGAVVTDTRYVYRVRALKDGGYTDFSPWADAMVSATVPAAPTGLSVFPTSSTTVDAGWTNVATNATSIRVERSTSGGPWTTIQTASWQQQQATDVDATPDAEACYRVFAVNDKGDSPSSNVDCARPIAGPTDLTPTTAGSDAVDLAWTNHSAFATAIEVHRVECYSYYYGYDYCYVAESVTLDPSATTHHFTGLSPASDYLFEVVARAEKNGQAYYSTASNQVTGSTAP
ncbi:MAG TPA: hypothetical protein VHM30_16105 [Gemmatimonadaceae bacterium]|nr:hypothetical protein [Gemmatimonadaceae bacterium]